MNQLRHKFAIVIAIVMLIGFVGCIWFAAAAPHSSATGQATEGQPVVHLTLLGTTDIHGNIEPYNYPADKVDERSGLSKISTLVRAIRKEQPNALLLDSGDMIQGTPVVFYAATREPAKPNPMMLVMNAMGYTAAALGNHEFNFGLENLWKAKSEAHFPILAANIKQVYENGPRHFEPYIIKNVDGVRVGIVGFVTQGIPHWEVPDNYKGYEFESIVTAARRVIPEVRAQADVVVALVHSGLGPDPDDPAPPIFADIPGENETLELAKQVPDIDVILFGHTHSEVAERFVNGVLLTQARNWGGSLARVDLDVSSGTDGKWKITNKHSKVIHTNAEVPADPEILKLAAPHIQATKVYLDTPVAQSDRDMRAATSRFEDEPLTDLIHAVQLENGHADVSMATMLYTGARIPKGPVSIRQMTALYLYENYLYVLEMTGAQFRNALEHAASIYQPWPLPSGEPLRLPNYDADSAAGVNYVIDLRQPAGRRVLGLTYKGKPLDDTQKLRVAINNYRYGGGGRYDVYKGLPIVYRSTKEIRDLVVEYLTKRGKVPTTSNNNWHIEPKEAVDALRQLALQNNESSSGLTRDSIVADFAKAFAFPRLPRDTVLSKPALRFAAAAGN